MTKESRCHEIGISGQCGPDCEVLLMGGCGEYLDFLLDANAKRDQAIAACKEALEHINYVITSRKGSIGDIHNAYLPQVNRKRADALQITLRNAIATVKEA